MKSQRKRAVLAAAISITIFAFGCSGDGSEDSAWDRLESSRVCVDSGADVTLATPFAYGHLVEGTGADSDAWYQVDNCGWIINEGHRGGYGDTLEITKDNVILVWAYNDFNGFTLVEGWSGSTNRGIGLGVYLSDFLDVYPEAVRDVLVPEARVYTIDASRDIEAVFDENGYLRMLNAGYGRFRYFLSDDPFYDASYLDFGIIGEDLPGSWPDSIDIPRYAKVYLVEVPYRYEYSDEINESSRVRLSVRVESKGLSTFCLDTGRTQFYQEVARDGEVCAEDYLVRDVTIKTYYNEYSEDWRFESLAILVSSTGATGNYEISIDCPAGEDAGVDSWERLFCRLE